MTLDRLLRIAIWSVVLLGAVAAIAPFVTELSVLGVLFVGFVWLPFAAVLAVLWCLLLWMYRRKIFLRI